MLTKIGEYIGLTKYYKLEHKLIQKCYDLNQAKAVIDITDIQPGIKATEKKLGYTFTDEQVASVQAFVDNNVLVVTGQAGTGKTGVVSAITEVCTRYSTLLCALSAKAAQRMREVSKEGASTVHRALGFNGRKFTYNSKNTWPFYCIQMDETSMNDLNIMEHTLDAIALGSKIVFVGDHHQLPPIGAGAFFKDLIDDPLIKTCYLTKILRQEAQSGIIKDSNIVKNKLSPIDDIKLDKWYTSGELKDMFYYFSVQPDMLRENAYRCFYKGVKEYGIDNVMMIIPMKRNNKSSTREMNNIISMTLNGDKKVRTQGEVNYRLEDKVIQRRNDYAGKNVINGDIGYIVDINDKQTAVQYPDREENVMYYNSELNELELAYAITVHLSQGSQYDMIVILIDKSHWILLSNQLLYTALTRAVKRCVLLAHPEAFKRALNTSLNERVTFLSKQRLIEAT